jgi:hypothetical protein
LGWGLDGASVREDTRGPHLNRGCPIEIGHPGGGVRN